MEVPAGSYIIFVSQPQRTNVLALFEPQIYPNRLTANGEAERPYDVAGWTLPLQLGVDAPAVLAIRESASERNWFVPSADSRSTLKSTRDSGAFERSVRRFSRRSCRRKLCLDSIGAGGETSRICGRVAGAKLLARFFSAADDATVRG